MWLIATDVACSVVCVCQPVCALSTQVSCA